MEGDHPEGLQAGLPAGRRVAPCRGHADPAERARLPAVQPQVPAGGPGGLVPSQGGDLRNGRRHGGREGGGRGAGACQPDDRLVLRHGHVHRREGQRARLLWLPGHEGGHRESSAGQLHAEDSPGRAGRGLPHQVGQLPQHPGALGLRQPGHRRQLRAVQAHALVHRRVRRERPAAPRDRERPEEDGAGRREEGVLHGRDLLSVPDREPEGRQRDELRHVQPRLRADRRDRGGVRRRYHVPALARLLPNPQPRVSAGHAQGARGGRGGRLGRLARARRPLRRRSAPCGSLQQPGLHSPRARRLERRERDRGARGPRPEAAAPPPGGVRAGRR
mmetsp:Transcript_57058/g.177069  ORF Transcript_57058/g.177069 Transcript_57058/m.177069 type:complete len:332 (-) Transcript_57058:384-1379(-)